MNEAMPDSSEDVLVRGAQSGDRDAYLELVRRVQGRLYATVFGMTRNHQDADDLLQETFLTAYRALPGFGGRSSFYTWIYRIAVNLTLNHLKKAAREKGRESLDGRPDAQASNEPGDPSPEGVSSRAELREKLHGAIAKLPPLYRAAFDLVALQGMPHARAAEVLGCSENTVSWRMHKARKMLQARLKGDL
jgi:RNA polymerase sigma-70 factor (ECF subfamily)